MTEDDFNEIMALLDELSTELHSEAQSVSPSRRLQKYFGNWLLTRVRLHIYAAYSGCLTYGAFPQHSGFYVNESGFRLILAEGYLLYAVEIRTGLMYVYDTEDWVEWIRRLYVRIEELFLYTDTRTPRPLSAEHNRRHLTLKEFLRQGPRPYWPDEGHEDFFVGVNQQDLWEEGKQLVLIGLRRPVQGNCGICGSEMYWDVAQDILTCHDCGARDTATAWAGTDTKTGFEVGRFVIGLLAVTALFVFAMLYH